MTYVYVLLINITQTHVVNQKKIIVLFPLTLFTWILKKDFTNFGSRFLLLLVGSMKALFPGFLILKSLKLSHFLVTERESP